MTEMPLPGRRSTLREDAGALLSELGSTEAEVSSALICTGVELTARTDEGPLERFLRAVAGADRRVRGLHVTKRWLVLRTPLGLGGRVRVRLPDAVRSFVLQAQRGRVGDAASPRSHKDDAG